MEVNVPLDIELLRLLIQVAGHVEDVLSLKSFDVKMVIDEAKHLDRLQ